MAHCRSYLVFLALGSLLFRPARAALTNRTIDDQDATFFTFNGSADANPPSWAAITPAAPCGYCSAQPHTTDIHNQTWHDGSVGSIGSFTFQGAAVYIYGIDLADPANISFTLNDQTSFHYYAGNEQFVFNALLFTADNLAEGVTHTVAWVVIKSKTNGTTALFDYAVVSAEETASSTTPVSTEGTSTPKSSRKGKAGTIVGAVIGAIAGLALFAVALMLLFRRRRKHTPHVTADETAPRATRNRADYVVQPFAAQRQDSSTLEDSSWPASTPVRSTASSKTQDAGWSNPAPTLARDPEMSTLAPTVTSTTSTDLAERIAVLEAHVNMHLPPPYEGPPRSE
ncbi:hypothetical protein C8R46DRAFT_1358147 [Mycena filopes]|nr:hypothetical protein C8R46DRAFT_1358147 [Mycena filopes]